MALTLNRRGRHFDEWRKPEGSFVYQTGGGISNRQPWDGSSEEWTPESFTLADIVNEGGNIRSISSGHWKYAFNKGTTSQGGFAGNEFRVYPIRGNHSVFYSIAPQTPVELEYEVIPAQKAIKIYKDTPDVQYAFYVGISGWKLANFIRATYGSDTFQQKFNVRLEGGIEKIGRTLVYQGKVVGKLPSPQFTENATGDAYDITESLNAGELTLSIAGLNALDLSQGGIFDPTLGPIGNSMDTWLYKQGPTGGWGQYTFYQIVDTANTERGLMQFDISAIPAGSTITSGDLVLNRTTGGATSTIDTYRLTVYDWEDAGTTGTANAEANWNNYKDPNVAWPGGAGALGDTDATLKFSTVLTFSGVQSFDVTAMSQDAIDSRSGLLNIFQKFPVEDTTTGSALFASEQHGTPSLRPALTVVYELGGANVLMGGGLLSSDVLSGGSFNNFGGFGL